MKKDLEKTLLSKYPQLLKGVRYFEIDDGWYKIIDLMCAQIESHITQSRNGAARSKRRNRALIQALRGNFTNIEYRHKNLPDSEKQQVIDSELNNRHFTEAWLTNIPNKIHFVQIKEKFGTLRAYAIGGDQFCNGVIAMAESMSGITCEACGEPGERTNNSWIKTQCKKCSG
jgi:hypothetical protein